MSLLTFRFWPAAYVGFLFLVLLKKFEATAAGFQLGGAMHLTATTHRGFLSNVHVIHHSVLCNYANCRPRDRPGGSGPSLASLFVRCHGRQQRWSYCGSYWGVRGSRQPTTLWGWGGVKKESQYNFSTTGCGQRVEKASSHVNHTVGKFSNYSIKM